jgi:formylglycine-generating enzyme required for sulfatase activity
MSDPDRPDLSAQLALLQDLHKRGLLSEADYHTELANLGVDPRTIFNQQQQTVEQQLNIAEVRIDQRPETAGPDPAALRRSYLNRLVQQTRRLPLSGVDPKTARDEESGELQLSAVYTALLTQRPELDEIPPAGRSREEMEGERRRLSALEVLNREPRLVLLGDPGSGKSTFVNFVALCLAGEALGDEGANLALLTAPLPDEAAERRAGAEASAPAQPWDHGPLLPVRIILRDLAAQGLPEPGQPLSGDALWGYIEVGLGQTLQEYAPHLKKELLEQGGLILLDGLDEVPDARQRREGVKQVVQDFAAAFPRCRFLVTSRIYAYQRQEWKLAGFAEAILSPFTPGQVARFVDRWYAHLSLVRHLNLEDAQGSATLLKTTIERSERLAELAARPLLLTLMASLHAWRGGNLPEKREALYADAVDLLLDQWESPKVVRDARGQPLIHQPSLAEWLKVDRAVVRAELNRLAFEAHRDQPGLVGTADIAQERLVGALLRVARNPEVNPNRLVEYIRDRAGLLVARGEGVYSFPHRTFQEYLAACHLTDEGYPDDLAEALCYHEPPAAGAVSEADGRGALLAAQCLLENEGERLARVSGRNAPKLARIRGWLLAIVIQGRLPPVDRAQAGAALAVLGDEREFDELVTIPAGPFWLGDDGDEWARPQHQVALPEYKIGKYPVTNAQYRRFVEATGRGWYGQDFAPEQANHPAAWLTWHDARAYCDWLTEIWRPAGRIKPGQVVRLPSEAEWEKAARGHQDRRDYPWGDGWDETKCNTRELGLGEPTPVGIFPEGASPYGCLDMAGNVWEWTRSLWGFEYPYDPQDGREDVSASDEVSRVLRGGAFVDDRAYARCAARGDSRPWGRSWYLGFRVVVSPNFPPSAL